MKYSFIFVLLVSFTFFSCGGSPKSNTTMPIPPKADESKNEPFISSVPEFEPSDLEEFSAEELPIEESYAMDTHEEEIAESDITDESAVADYPEQGDAVTETEEPEPVIEAEPVTEITLNDESEFAPQVAQSAEVPQQPPEEQDEILSPVIVEPVTPPVQTQSAQTLLQPQTQTQPLSQTQPNAQTRTPSQVQSPVQTQNRTPAQVQTQSQTQIQPPVQTTRQPQSAQAPLPLASAEERPLIVRESTPEQPSRIDTAKDDPVTPFQTVLTPQNETIKFSRIVHAAVGQLIEIPFRGAGWVYLGEVTARRGIVYDSSRSDTEGQSIILRVEDSGVYALKFSRNDLLRDFILNDYVQVIAESAPVSSGAGWFNPPVDMGRVIAQPRWPTAVEEAEILRGGTGSVPVIKAPPADVERGTVSSQGTASAQEPAQVRGAVSAQSSAPVQQATQPPAAASVSSQAAAPEAASQAEAVEAQPDVILQRAKDAFNGGNIPAAIALLDQYGKNYQSGTDELYWLYGQFYEANSPSRNILLSLDYYRRLVREYPQSSRYNEARSRIAYLERYYINIQ